MCLIPETSGSFIAAPAWGVLNKIKWLYFPGKQWNNWNLKTNQVLFNYLTHPWTQVVRMLSYYDRAFVPAGNNCVSCPERWMQINELTSVHSLWSVLHHSFIVVKNSLRQSRFWRDATLFSVAQQNIFHNSCFFYRLRLLSLSKICFLFFCPAADGSLRIEGSPQGLNLLKEVLLCHRCQVFAQRGKRLSVLSCQNNFLQTLFMIFFAWWPW